VILLKCAQRLIAVERQEGHAVVRWFTAAALRLARAAVRPFGARPW
jgi:hypothetical protein